MSNTREQLFRLGIQRGRSLAQAFRRLRCEGGEQLKIVGIAHRCRSIGHHAQRRRRQRLRLEGARHWRRLGGGSIQAEELEHAGKRSVEDIDRRIDRRVTLPRRALTESETVTIGLLGRTIRDPDGDRLLPTASPIHFNRSAICSFSPFGESTPGTIYLTDRREELYAVRVYGTTAKVRTLRYDAPSQKWVSR